MAAYTTIDDPSAHFQTLLHNSSGNTAASYTFDGNSDLQPDLVWHKNRTVTDENYLFDSTRGAEKAIYTNLVNAEATHNSSLTSFDSNGYSVGSSNVTSGAGTYASWCWKANGGTTSSNTDGTITSTVQANTDAGFSIVTFTGNGSNDATIGHGLGVTPAFIITKNRADSVSWRVWHKDLTSTYSLFINSNNGQTSPTGQGNGYIKTVGSSTYSVYQGLTDTNGVNGSGDAMVSYCFAEKQGYSRFGKYTGNGNANGTFIYTGFKPAVVINKRIDAGGPWTIFDNARCPNNVNNAKLFPHLNDAEVTTTGDPIDFLSNGYKLRGSGADCNVNGGTYIYMAFAENPFVTSTGIPTTAR